jgi:antirestriction protein ArdC
VKNRSQSPSVYQIVTDRIVAKLESGVVPWRRPWGEYGAPMNLASRRAYRGVNVFLLSAMGFESPYWMTYRQAQERGANVRKGERATPVVFWKTWEKDETDDAGEKCKRRIPVLRYYNLFNVAQCDGIEAPPTLPVSRPFAPVAECERIVSGMPNAPTIQNREARAYYAPTLDLVNMPLREAFTSEPEYYSTLFHELTHSTGHEKRLGRRGSNVVRHFGDRDYSQEELVAEMGAAFLCAVAGIESATLDSSAAYLNGWIRRLRGDSKLIVVAAAQAQKAADFILGNLAAEGETAESEPVAASK